MAALWPLAVMVAINAAATGAMPEPEAGLTLTNRLRRQATAKGGKCSTSDDCIAPNVCSKWGWCQWTTIYGQDGPAQGSAAPDGGHSGQCVTSADCASRVPYCSRLGFCHGGRLPFDEEQLEIEGSDVEDESQGYVNNNPPKNSPVLRGTVGRLDLEDESQGYVNNNPPKNSPALTRTVGRQDLEDETPAYVDGDNNSNNNNISPVSRASAREQSAINNNRNVAKKAKVNKAFRYEDSRKCPTDANDADACVAAACEAVKVVALRAYQACARECKERCQ